MNEKRVKEEQINYYLITESQALHVLQFLQDLDIPTKSLKSAIQIMTGLPRVGPMKQEEKKDEKNDEGKSETEETGHSFAEEGSGGEPGA